MVTDLLTEPGVEQKAIASSIADEVDRRGLLDKAPEAEIEAA